jgi:GNAT superfamily N-acetyltransferase
MMDVVVRELTPADVEVADGIYQASYRSAESRKAEMRRYLALPSSCWLLALLRGEPVGMVGAVSYGRFASLGLMGVRPEAQRQGVGRALMVRLLEWADGTGIPTVILDATEEGAPLYRSCGFVAGDRALLFRLQGQPASGKAPPTVRVLERETLASVVAFDARYFGAEREAVVRGLLEAFPGRGFVCSDPTGALTGYLLAQGRRLGPWVARGAAEAAGLFQAAMALSFAASPTVIVPESNAAGCALVSRHGFDLVRSCVHMWRGASPTYRRRDALYGQESFALG